MSSNSYLIGIISVIMFLALVYGFTIIGSPEDTRGKKFDQTRVTHLTTLRSSIDNYYSLNKKLPESLDSVQSNSSYISTYRKDPETNTEYLYTPTNEVSYKLCATFNADSKDDTSNISMHNLNSEYSHPKGYHCFNFQIPQYMRATPTPYVILDYITQPVNPTPSPRP